MNILKSRDFKSHDIKGLVYIEFQCFFSFGGNLEPFFRLFMHIKVKHDH